MSGGAGLLVVVNYAAARARAAWGGVRAALDESGVSFEAHEARQFGDARAAAAAALRAGYGTIAVVGGDGTLGEVVSGFFARADEDERESADESEEARGAAGRDESRQLPPAFARGRDESGQAWRPPAPINPAAALAVLPAGTGNDFARALEGRRATLGHWLARLVAHCRRDADEAAAGAQATTRAVDVLHGTVDARRVACERAASSADARGVAGVRGVGAAGEFLCLNAVTLGVGAEVAARVAAQGARVRRLPGEARFALAALGALAGWRERRVLIRLEGGEPFESATNLVAVVNSPFAGGGMMFSPEARLDDGLADVVTAGRLTRAVVVREMARIHRGGHVRNPRVRIRRTPRVTIEPLTPADALPVEADGDVRGHTPLTIRVLPRALRVVA